MEEWKKIVGMEGRVSDKYEVSTMGNIRNSETGYVRNSYIFKDGTYQRNKVTMVFPDKTFSSLVGKIVLTTFIHPPEQGEVVSYKNGNVFDDRLENLEWSTPKIRDQVHNVKEYQNPVGEVRSLDFTNNEVHVSSDGYVKSIQGGWTKGNNGGNYLTKSISYNMDGTKSGPKGNSIRVHVLIAYAFLGPRPDGLVIDHKNGNKLDNRACNLEYVSVSENMKRAYKEGGFEGPGKKHVYKYSMSEIGKLEGEYESVTDASIAMGKSNTSAICQCANGKRMNIYGYEWSYLKPDEYIKNRPCKIIQFEEHAKIEAGKRKERNGPPKVTGKRTFAYFSENKKFKGEYKSAKEASMDTGCNTANISNCKSGKLKSTGGYIFSNLDKESFYEEHGISE